MLQHSSIQALLNLVDDPDDQIYQHVRGELVKCGTTALPILESTWETDLFGSKHHERIDKIIQEIQFEEVKKELKGWLESSEKDLVKGACVLAKYENPTLDETEIVNAIQNIRRDIWLELVKIFNKIFFNHHKFEGDKEDYFSPSNSLINKVLESRKGNPLSLGLVYSVIAQSLDLPIYGVNLPNHFILAYMDVNGVHAQNDQQNEYGVLFYINTFSRGSIFSTDEIKSFLDILKVEHKRDFYEPCSNTTIIRRMLTNLISSYQQSGKAEIIDNLVELRGILD
jgi:regulator of sirC expression with transglutaminase-like and TPR domain